MFTLFLLTYLAQSDTDPAWTASVQAGAGRLAEDAALLVRPRLEHRGERVELTLSLPMWMRVADLPPQQGASPAWMNDWSRPATYLGMLERLSFASVDGDLRLEAGSLARQTLGYAVLVDDYAAALDPLEPRTGMSLGVDRDFWSASAFVDHVLRPHLVAASVTGLPLLATDLDAARRVTLTMEAALDPHAPTESGRQPFGGVDATLAYAAWSNARLSADVFVAVAYLSRAAPGAHTGARFRWSEGARSVEVRGDVVAAGHGYLPGYFDAAYALDRGETVSGVAKADARLGAAMGARGAVDVAWRWLNAGLQMTKVGEVGQLRGRLRVTRPNYSLGAFFLQRSLAGARDLVDVTPHGAAMLEGSLRLVAGLFALPRPSTACAAMRRARPPTGSPAWAGQRNANSGSGK